MISNATGEGKRDPGNKVGNQSGDLSPCLILSNLTGQRGHHCWVAVAFIWPENSLEIWVGVCGMLLETLTLSQSKICVFPHPSYFRPNPKSWRGGGGVVNKVLYGEAPPQGPNPLVTLLYTIFGRKGTPFVYPP